MLAWRFVDLRDLDIYRFQCLREALAISVGEGLSSHTLLFAQLPREHVSVGKNASIKQMVHHDFCESYDIPITRTMSLSRASVLMDSNTIRTVIVVNKDIDIADQLFYEAAIASLRGLGLEAERIPKTNNIVIKGKKISMCGIHPHGKSILFSWSVALDFNYDKAEKTIVSPKGIREWITTVKKELGREVSVDELKSSVKQGFQQTLGIEFEEGELSTQELSNIEKLLPKYTSETWLKYGKWSPVKDYWRPE